MRTLRNTLAILALVGPMALAGCGDPGNQGVTDNGSARPDRVGCDGKCDGPISEYVSPYKADMQALNEIYPKGPAMETVEDAFKVRVDLGEIQFDAPTHLFGKPVNVIPYSDDDGTADVTGKVWERRDAAIAEVFPPGAVGYAVKHHRPEYRTLSPSDIQEDIKEQVKLQDTHIEIVVGVERDGEAGAITLNNPQNYQGGLFGDKVYSMIFLAPKYPEYLGEVEQIRFNDNIRTMTLAFNAVSNFPGDYNGGDPLAANNSEKLREHVRQMVLAVGGDEDARAWFKDPANQVYCAELAFIGASAGMHFPLNDATMVPLVGEEAWDLFKAEVEKHDAGEASAFTELNENEYAELVTASLAPEDLKPAYDYAPNAAGESQKLAFKPMTMADIIQQFLRTHVPREQLGEQLAPVQGQLLQAMYPGLLENMAMDQVPAEDPRRQAVDQLFGALVETVSQPYEDYAAFQAAIAPLMQQARQVTGPRDDSGTGFFVPPSLLHVVAQGKQPGGLLGLDYVGHGVHISATYTPEEQEPEEPELDSVDEDSPFSGSCASACGGSSPDGNCWCDDQCADFGDCCADLAEVCE